MRTAVVHGCDLVDGTGGAPRRGIDIVISGDTIREIVPARPAETYGRADEIVEAGGALAIPGLINNHTHGTAYGPLFPSGHNGLAHEQVRANLDRHLLEGTTTVLCVDGFVTAEALARTNDDHPVTVKLASCNTPACLRAASVADGSGLTDETRAFTARQAVGAGAVALGEIGAGHTLGGGGASYMYIPAEVAKRTGVTITPRQADALKVAVLGRHISASSFDRDAARRRWQPRGWPAGSPPGDPRDRLGDHPARFRHRPGRARRGRRYARQADVPVLVHNAAASMSAGRRDSQDWRAAHRRALQPFELRAARGPGTRRAAQGTGRDHRRFHPRHIRRAAADQRPELFYAMLQGGLADTISTDYAGGYHDAILLAIDRATKAGAAGLPAAIAMATANVADAIPEVAPRRGRLTPGAVADIVLTDPANLPRVRTVIIGGETVVRDGARVTA